MWARGKAFFGMDRILPTVCKEIDKRQEGMTLKADVFLRALKMVAMKLGGSHWMNPQWFYG